ncbi:SKP1-like 11 [Artemisia annua]|uniref:SKP1-like protein n=1 Tax=Artemisia annua TaxID=35608 RepID=A0A2U1QD07_ARTAN|nr:SKP1-like 11 [Artemisia annua]
MAWKVKTKSKSNNRRLNFGETIVIGGPPKETEQTVVSSSNSMTKAKTARLVTSDRVYIEVDVDELIDTESHVFKNWIKYDGTGALRLTFKANIVLKVIEFCKKHGKIRNSDDKLAHENLKDFHSEFVKENHSILIDLLTAACDLQIRSLLDVTSETVVDMINGKTAEEIHRMFNLKEDFTFKEMEEVLEFDAFCFRGIM